eukprot:scaffold1461_cov253-Pinguiococcus_pyrenoidosus.AAC.7
MQNKPAWVKGLFSSRRSPNPARPRLFRGPLFANAILVFSSPDPSLLGATELPSKSCFRGSRRVRRKDWSPGVRSHACAAQSSFETVFLKRVADCGRVELLSRRRPPPALALALPGPAKEACRHGVVFVLRK